MDAETGACYGKVSRWTQLEMAADKCYQMEILYLLLEWWAVEKMKLNILYMNLYGLYNEQETVQWQGPVPPPLMQAAEKKFLTRICVYNLYNVQDTVQLICAIYLLQWWAMEKRLSNCRILWWMG